MIGIKSHGSPDVAVEDVLDPALAFDGSDALVTLESEIVRAVNPAALRMLGLAEGAKPIGGPLDPWWPEPTRSELQRAMTAAASGHPQQFRARFSTPQPTWWDCTAIRLPDVPHTLALSCRDVTELVEIRSALALADARLRALTEHPRSVSWFMRKDGTLTQTSRRWRTFTGVDQPVCDVATWLELIHPEDRDRILHDTRVTLAGTDTRETTYRTLRADGEYRWVRRRTMPVRDAEGKLIEWVGFATDVTEAREVEIQGRLLQQLVDTTPNLIELADPDGRLRYLNPAGRELVGIDPDSDITGLRPSDYTAPESRILLETVVVPTARDRGIWDGEMQLINRETGARIDIHRITLGLRDTDGRHTGYSTVTRNITDAKRARAALAESERRFRGTFEQAAVGIAHVSLDGHWLLVNARLCAFLGYSEADLRKLTFQQLTHPDDLASDLKQVENLLAGTLATYTMEKRYRHRDGHVVWANLTVSLLRDETGAPNRFISVVEDIGRRKLAEAALQDSTARFRNLVEALPQIAFVANTDGWVTFHNRRWSDYSGLPPDGATGRSWLHFVHPDDARDSAAAWDRAVRTGEPFGIEHRMRAADGRYRWFLLRGVPLRDADGVATEWLATSTDISDIVAAREAAARHEADLEMLVAERTRALSDAAQELAQEIRRREEIQAMLQQTRKLEALGQLTGGVAHDFNNILAAIIGSYSSIRRRTDSPALLDVVARGEQAAERASALVRQLLSFARKQELTPQPLDVKAILGETDDLIAHSIGRKIKRVTDIAGDAWPVLADPQQLEVALLNLAVNARDAMPDGGTLTFSARNLRHGERPNHLAIRSYVAIGVSDTGYGMPPSVAARAVEPFFTTKKAGEGTGLGLAMVHGFAEQSGGSLVIDSQVGVGTKVEILLPRADRDVTSEQATDEVPELDLALHGGAMVLVVEADDPMRQATAGMLRDLRYTVVEARNAEVAQVLVYALERLDLVITSIEMPGADGPTLAARLRVDRPSLPVLFMTGQPFGAAAGSETLLIKPFSRAVLAAAVLERLGRQTLIAQLQPSGARSLLARVRTVALRDLYFAWNGLRAGDVLPAAADLHPAQFGLQRHSFLLSVRRAGEAIDMRFLSAGDALTVRLGRDLSGERVGADPGDEEVLGSLEAAYRRCVRDRQPVYQFIRFDFGDGSPTRFERLLLPLTESGEDITHLLGVTLFDETPV